MKKLLCLALLLSLVAVSCDDGWKVYDASEFSISFPGTPRDTATIQAELSGARTYFEPVQGSLDSNVYYSISMYTLPDTVDLLGSKLDDYFRKDVEIYAWSIGGILADTGRTVKSGEIEGREYKVTLEGNSGTATVRKFAYGKHLYTLLVITANDRLGNHCVNRFLDSFRLKGKKKK